MGNGHGLSITITVLIFFVLSLASVLAQTGTTPPTRGRTDPVQRELQRKVDMEIIENALRKNNGRHSGRYPPLVLEQIRDDFLRIQVVDRRLAQATSSNEKLDVGLVAKSTAEIKKRATRLKKNLALPELEAESARRPNPDVQLEPERLRASLAMLSSLIDRFVSNPIFKESKLVDTQLSAQALQDLKTIIATSDEIKRTSEKLKPR